MWRLNNFIFASSPPNILCFLLGTPASTSSLREKQLRDSLHPLNSSASSLISSCNDVFWQFFRLQTFTKSGPCDVMWCERGEQGLARLFHATPPPDPHVLAFCSPPRSTMHRWKCDKCRLPYLFHSVQWSLAKSTPTAGRKSSTQEAQICCA